MTSISGACMVGKQSLISVDCARETSGQPTEARIGNHMMDQHQLPVSRRPSVPLSWDWCTRYGRQRRPTFVVLSVYRFPWGRYGHGAYDHMWELVEVAQFASAPEQILQEHVGTLVEVGTFASVQTRTDDWM
jgi:hypothetical protein